MQAFCHFMAFWHFCQTANCITKSAVSAFSAFFRLFPPFRPFHRIRLLDFPALGHIIAWCCIPILDKQRSDISNGWRIAEVTSRHLHNHCWLQFVRRAASSFLTVFLFGWPRPRHRHMAEMRFVKRFTQPYFQARKIYTLKGVFCDYFTKEIFALPMAYI